MRERAFAAALAAVLSGIIVQVHAGQLSPSTAPTFSKDVAPIFYKNCTTCHRPGELAPMSLLTFADARPWARSIHDHVTRGTMPPWHAVAAYGRFANERRLTEVEKDTIARWFAAGAPEGDARDLPIAPRYAEGWTIGQPDVILSMQEEYPIPAAGTIPYSYFEVPTNFTEDTWVQAFELRPGDTSVVHHIILYTKSPRAGQGGRGQPSDGRLEGSPQPPVEKADGRDFPREEAGPRPDSVRAQVLPSDRPAPRDLGLAGSILGYVPGTTSRVFAPGAAMRLVAGSTLVFQMHYTTTGKATADRTRIGLVFAKKAPKNEIRLEALSNANFQIPAGAAEYRVDAETIVKADVTLYSMLPHAHVRGIRWRYEATYPDGRTETILSVPKYDFNWQTDYIFAQPLRLPRGTKIHATAWYDNSRANRSNPDPTADVRWGDQTWEEMMFTGFTFSVDGSAATVQR